MRLLPHWSRASWWGALSLLTLLIASRVGTLHAEPATTPITSATAATANAETASFEATPATPRFNPDAADINAEVERILAAMTLDEKIGQMCQVWPEEGRLTPAIRKSLQGGEIGSLINCPDRASIDVAQKIACEQSRLGIPLLVGRDVVHGYRTVFPIPLGQAASWNPALIEQAAAVAAEEARGQGINWTFAPMVDVGRDPRWGRIAETLGEDPQLSGTLAAAMVRGFQQEKDGRLYGVAACAKHFAAYGLSEGGRDYNRASLSLADLHNVHLPPFHDSLGAGCRTLMTTFSEVNGVPGTAHAYLLQEVLRDGWKFPGLVVSDWNSVIEMVAHGYSADAADAARQAVTAGVHLEMVSTTFHDHLATHIEQGRVPVEAVDEAVRRILRVKMELATPRDAATSLWALLRPRSLELARRAARESIVLLKNEEETLPLHHDKLRRIAVIGPLADAPLSQLGCWSVDGNAEDTITPIAALRDACGEGVEVEYIRGLPTSVSQDVSEFDAAAEAAADADVTVLFVGEDAILSGEARSRAELSLPGEQSALLRHVAKAGKPMVLVVLAGRPLTIGDECAAADAVLYAWHPGTMGGPAIADILFGAAVPSGKLPITIPKQVGQVPLYYGHPNTGRPSPADYRALDPERDKDLPQQFQYRSHYIDADPFPLFPFGFGLSYTTFVYDRLKVGATAIEPGEEIEITARLTNSGSRAGVEVAQLYVRDMVASVVRPVRELKDFRRVYLRPGESKQVKFTLDGDDLSFFDNQGRRVLEPGRFAVWIGDDSTATLEGTFEVRGQASTPIAPPSIARAPQEAEPLPVKQPVGADAGT